MQILKLRETRGDTKVAIKNGSNEENQLGLLIYDLIENKAVNYCKFE